MSATQAALAVVATLIGSSLLTAAAFYLFLRRKRTGRQCSWGLRGRDSGPPAEGRAPPADGAHPDAAEPVKPPPQAAAAYGLAWSDCDTAADGRTAATPGSITLNLFPPTPADASQSPPARRPRSGMAEPQPLGSPHPLQASGAPPSLERWLRAGTVSPLGRLVRENSSGEKGWETGGERTSLNWPFERAGGAMSAGRSPLGR